MTTETALVALFGSLIGAVIVFVGSLFSTFGKSKDTQLDVRTKVVTNERAQWRKDMRELAATYVALSNRIANAPKEDDYYELERSRVLLRLRLNANPNHDLDARILKVIQEIMVLVHAKDTTGIKAKLEAFETDMQALLKREWDKSKDEAESGNIAPSDG